LLKIYKSPAYGFGECEPVKLDNTVIMPVDESEAEFSEEELKAKRQAEKEAEEKRFNDAVDAEVARIIEARRAETENERNRILEGAKKEASSMAEDAKSTTAAVLERASKECAILKEKAKAEGFKEGFDEGKRQSLEKCSKYVDAAAQLLSDINAHKDAYYMENEEELKETLFCMVEKVTKSELKSDPKVIERIIEDAAKSFRNSDYIKISLAEGQVSRELKSDDKFIKQIIPYIPDIDVEILPDAEEGTVILDNGEEISDASVPTQLEFLKEILKNTRGENNDNAESDEQ
jgi:flagellar assembly protein FliH